MLTARDKLRPTCADEQTENSPRTQTQSESDPYGYCRTASGDKGRTICRAATEVNVRKVVTVLVYVPCVC